VRHFFQDGHVSPPLAYDGQCLHGTVRIGYVRGLALRIGICQSIAGRLQRLQSGFVGKITAFAMAIGIFSALDVTELAM